MCDSKTVTQGCLLTSEDREEEDSPDKQETAVEVSSAYFLVGCDDEVESDQAQDYEDVGDDLDQAVRVFEDVGVKHLGVWLAL